MKFTDTLGRTLDVAVVAKAPELDMWMEPLGYNLDNSQARFLRLPLGPFALRVISSSRADLLVHLNGKRLLATPVMKGVQYLEQDEEGNEFRFGLAAKCARQGASEHVDQPDHAIAGDGVIQTPPEMMEAQPVPDGDGLLFVAVRFANDPIYEGQQPPTEEFSFAFQLQEPWKHDRRLAENLSRVVQPALPGESDVVMEVAASDRPSFHCTCTGCTSMSGRSSLGR
jgi:hypothetical protein